ADPRVIRLLLQKGADQNIKSNSSETAVDWAKKFQNAEVIQAFDLASNDKGRLAVEPLSKAPELTEALTRSIALLQRVNSKFMDTGGCVSCHGQNLTGMAVQAARVNGVQVNEALAAEQAKTVRLSWAAFEQPLLQRMDTPGGTDDLEYSLFQM